MGNLSFMNSQMNFKGNNSANSCIAAHPPLPKNHFQKIFRQNKLTLRFGVTYISNFNQAKNFILIQKDKFFLENLRKDRNMMKTKTFTLFSKKEHSQFNNLKHRNKTLNKPLKSLIGFN